MKLKLKQAAKDDQASFLAVSMWKVLLEGRLWIVLVGVGPVALVSVRGELSGFCG